MLSDLNVATHQESGHSLHYRAAVMCPVTDRLFARENDPSYTDRNGELRQALPRVADEDTAKWKCVPLGTAFIWTNQIVLKHSHDSDGSPNSQALWS